jgi:hypothetical protein
MTPDGHMEALAGQPPRRCPSCGTPYPAGDGGVGCSVCQFQRLLKSEEAEDEEGRFDHYELEPAKNGAFEELGRGAMGITYKAFDVHLRRPVTLTGL